MEQLQAGRGEDVINEKVIGIAAKLYQARRLCRELMGDVYAQVIKTYKDAIRRVMFEKHLDTLQAAALCIQTATHDGDAIGAMKYMAACVEIIEPSNPQNHQPGEVKT